MRLTARTVSELAALVGGRVSGDGSISIQNVANLEAAGAGDIAYVEDPKLFASANQTRASCVITPYSVDVKASCRIEVKNPKLAFALMAEVLHPSKQRLPEIHRTAVISPAATIGEDV